MLYTLALHSRLFTRLPVDRRIWIEAFLDLTWITAVILFSGRDPSPLFFLYYMVIYARRPRWAAARPTPRPARRPSGLGVVFLMDGAHPAALSAHARGMVGAGRKPGLAAHGALAGGLFLRRSRQPGCNLHRSLYLAAHTDALTGLPNLRHFTAMSDLRAKLEKPYTIVMVDADHLKRVNDTYGHAHGNDLIRTVTEALRSAARGDDLCSRIGGDEFIVRLEGATREGGLAYCRRVRTYLAEHPLRLEESSCRSRFPWAWPPTPSTAARSPR